MMLSTAHNTSDTATSWPHQWTDETRYPLFTFEANQKLYGFYLQSIYFWLELLAIIVVEASLASLVSIPLYYTIIKQEQISSSSISNQTDENKRDKKKRSTSASATATTLSFLLAYGLFIPFWLLLPKPALDALGVENMFFRFCMTVITPIIFVFRVTATVHGFVPQYAVHSLGDFALYFGSPMLLLHDKNKHLKVLGHQTLKNFGRFLLYSFLAGMWQSCFFCFPNHFPSIDHIQGGINKADWYHPSAFIDLLRWKEGAQFAMLMQLYLTAHGEGLVFATNMLTRCQAQPLMDNPMLASTSPSDFWGRRWNLLIHDCLKNGVYKPVIKQAWGSKAMAVTAAFIASGLFHEWLLPIVFTVYPHTHGATLMFFLWQGILIALEATIGHWKFFQFLGRILPLPLKTLCVVLLGLPWAHWFSESWLNSNFFVHASMTLPCVIPIKMG